MAFLTFPTYGGYLFIQTGTLSDISTEITVDESTPTVDASPTPTVDEA